MHGKTPPGPGRQAWLEVARLRRLGSHAYITDLVQRFGDVVLVKVGQFHAYLISDPALIGQILTRHHAQTTKGRETKRMIPYLGEGLLTSEGEVHKRQRRLLTPLFHRQVVAGYAEKMVASVEQVMRPWKDGAVVDMSQTMAQLSMTIAMKTLLDLDLTTTEAQTLYHDLRTTLQIYTAYLGLPFDVLINLHFLPATRAYEAALRRVNTTVFRIIREQQATKQHRSDLLALLVTAHQGETDEPALTVPEVRDQIMTLFFAGQETLSSALPWAWYCLAHHPQIAERMLDELDRVLAGRIPTADDLSELRYTTQVFQETLRLYPPIIALSRRVEEPLEVGGYPIGVGHHLYMSQFAVQRDARWWPDPLCFAPERFAPTVAEQRPRFAYFPFGGGPRQCIGEGFAMVEGIMTLAMMAQRWRMSLVDTSPPAFSANIISLRPKSPLRLRVHRR